MAKFFQIVLVVGLIAAGAAEPPRRFNQRFQNRNRFFARQEVAPSDDRSVGVTPYPSAAEEKPDIPFDLPNQEAAPFPEPTYATPDQTYGPPDQTYGPPQPEEAFPQQEDYDEEAADDDEPEAERLVFVSRRPGQRQSSRLVQLKGQRSRPQAAAAAQLRRPAAFSKSAKLRQPARLQVQRQNLIAQPILLQDGTLLYSIPV
ncbi:uncharacterized protein LOC129941969 [Eupeodes corollae]|uniref:uncharacterized protein LOC129941969 n=1 Tax=Eupeodes corollae TaxID=290404 RepID=UPI002491DCE2|nr:uncharacterized protein LOC129941969 [Eupeodes corollae]